MFVLVIYFENSITLQTHSKNIKLKSKLNLDLATSIGKLLKQVNFSWRLRKQLYLSRKIRIIHLKIAIIQSSWFLYLYKLIFLRFLSNLHNVVNQGNLNILSSEIKRLSYGKTFQENERKREKKTELNFAISQWFKQKEKSVFWKIKNSSKFKFHNHFYFSHFIIPFFPSWINP